MTMYQHLTINILNIPIELKDIIKSYCFFDKKTLKKQVEIIKNVLINKINTAIISRKNGLVLYNYMNIDLYFIDNNIMDSDNTEYWRFYINYEKKIIQAMNCKICGNYVRSANNYLPIKLRCNCFPNIKHLYNFCIN